MASAPVRSAIFRGDDPSLVDHLVAVCERKVSPTTNYTGFGRELVPYFDADTVVPLPRPHCQKSSSCGASPNRGYGRARNEARQQASPTNQGTRSGKSSPDTGKRRPARGSRNNQSPPPADMVALPTTTAPVPIRQQAAALGTPSAAAKKRFPATNAVACPGLFSASPKPEALPMPTTGLFHRAASVKNLDVTLDSNLKGDNGASKAATRAHFASLLSAALVPPAAA